jgi:hypothetical protein
MEISQMNPVTDNPLALQKSTDEISQMNPDTDNPLALQKSTDSDLATTGSTQNLVIARPVRHLEAIPLIPKQIELEEEEYIDGVSRIVLSQSNQPFRSNVTFSLCLLKMEKKMGLTIRSLSIIIKRNIRARITQV